ncbi:MAG TPA: hypothetical protein GX709_00170 [Clostridiales bacterium]|nr:hypothetical protein [Clostridiales bacterium]
MSKKKKNIENQDLQIVEKPVRRKTYTFRVLNTVGPVPIARPNDFIQLTPAVQPIPIMPYTDQMGGFEEDGYDEGFDDFEDDFY